MFEPKDALSSLSSTDYASLPSPEDLPSYLRESFAHAEHLLNSVPSTADPNVEANSQQKNRPTSSSSGTPFRATKAAETVGSTAYFPFLEERYSSVIKQWGKPLKLSQKENPLRVSVFKRAAHDRKGAWFARRSVHRGIGFHKFHKAMKREFLESLAVKEGPGSGAVRGIAGDKRLERKVVDGTGQIEVWQLSAKFGPITPREFIMMNITSEDPLTSASAPSDNPEKKPRAFMVISRPTIHSEAQLRGELVKGEYESCEMIRELPKDIATNNDEASDDPESNPVEWIMITRSDPGGGVPKFMVERGTPGSIAFDVAKFLDWACKQDEIPSDDEADLDLEIERQQSVSKDDGARDPSPEEVTNQLNTERAAAMVETHTSAADRATTPPLNDSTGWFSSIGNAVESTVGNYLPYFNSTQNASNLSLSSTASSSSLSSLEPAQHFDSAVERQISHDNDAESIPPLPRQTSHTSTDSTINNKSQKSPVPSTASAEALAGDISKPSNSNERELLKLTQKRVELDAKIAKAREDAERREKENAEKDEKDRAKATERHQKERQKQMEKYQRDMDKLEERQAREARKVEERRRKMVEKDILLRTQKERGEWKERCSVLARENELLRNQVEELQRENTTLAARMGPHKDGGLSVLQNIKDESSKTHQQGYKSGVSSSQTSLEKTGTGRDRSNTSSSTSKAVEDAFVQGWEYSKQAAKGPLNPATWGNDSSSSSAVGQAAAASDDQKHAASSS